MIQTDQVVVVYDQQLIGRSIWLHAYRTCMKSPLDLLHIGLAEMQDMGRSTSGLRSLSLRSSIEQADGSRYAVPCIEM